MVVGGATYRVAAVDEHLRLLFGPLFALFLVHDKGVVSELSLSFWEGNIPGGNETGRGARGGVGHG